MICDPFSGLETLIYTKITNWRTTNPMINISFILGNRLPHISTKETVSKLEIVLSHLHCLTSTRSSFIFVLSNFKLYVRARYLVEIRKLNMK